MYYACPNELFDITAASIYSLLDNTKSFVSIYVLDTNIGYFDKVLLQKELAKKYSNFELNFVENNDIDKTFAGCNTWNHFLDCWARFLFVEKVRTDRAIYLDSDTIVLDDIKRLWEQDLGGAAIGGIYDRYAGRKKRVAALGIADNHRYFGSGVLLIDCKKWREQGIVRKLIDSGKQFGKKFHFPDQDALNYVFNNNNYRELPEEFGVIAGGGGGM